MSVFSLKPVLYECQASKEMSEMTATTTWCTALRQER